MTLIECFADAHIDNISACLRLRPEKMVLIGKADEMRTPMKRYQKLLRQRGMNTQVSMCDIQGKDIGGIASALAPLIRSGESCVLDLTGGDEMVIMAVGAVLAGLDDARRQKIRVEKYDHNQNAVLDCGNENRRLDCEQVTLTVAELVALHGGSLYPDAYQPPKTYGTEALEGLWRMSSADSRAWNRAMMTLSEFESRSESKMQICLCLDEIRDGIRDFDRKEREVRGLLDRLHRSGVITDQSSARVLKYSYNSEMMRYCMAKAGNILEIKTLLEGRVAAEKGIPLFGDCRMSVSIDWDGVVDFVGNTPETRNEIDVVLMNGTTPLFVSCKNGNIGDEELYKLNTVAARFGGPYAKKMLVATELDRKSPQANRSFMQRAWDMDIFLVTDAAELTKEEWQAAFCQAVK